MKVVPLTLRDVVKTFELPTIDKGETVKSAIEKMLDTKCNHLLVPREDRNDAYGIVTKKDVLAKVVATGRDLSDVKVEEIMSRPLVILTNLSLDIRWVAKAMANSGVSSIVVFDKGDFYGYVTESCIIEGVYKAMRRARLEEGVDFVSC